MIVLEWGINLINMYLDTIQNHYKRGLKNMKTNKNITFNALNSWYLDTSDMAINEDYLNDAIIMIGSNTERFYKEYTQGKRKIHSVVWEMFMYLTNQHIKDNEYPYNQEYYCTSEQLKKWLLEYGHGYLTIAPAIEYFETERAEYKAG